MLPTVASAQEVAERERIRAEELAAWRERESERHEQEYRKLLADSNALKAAPRAGGEPAPGTTRR